MGGYGWGEGNRLRVRVRVSSVRVIGAGPHRELRVVGDRLGRGGAQVPLHVPGYHG